MMGASLLMMTFSFTMNANAQTCTSMPSCATLGYTETSCSGDSLKCPFDQTKLFCGGEKCQVGDIYYSDNTCSESYTSGKTVVGVVAGKGVIVNIDQLSSTYTWADAVDVCKSVTRGGKTAHLPTRGEGYIIMGNHNAINVGLSKISGAVQLTNDMFWTSEEYGDSAYVFFPFTPGEGIYAKTKSKYVRCVYNL